MSEDTGVHVIQSVGAEVTKLVISADNVVCVTSEFQLLCTGWCSTKGMQKRAAAVMIELQESGQEVGDV